MSSLQQRKPRFKREPTGRIQLTERDIEIIRQVYKHRFLRSTHIIALLGSSQQTTLRRLQLLYHHGYLDRPREQIEFYTRAGSKPMVYGLGNRGADLLTNHLAIPRGKVDLTAKNRSVKQIFLDHTLLVADFMVSLEVACRQDGKVRLIEAEEILAAAPEATQKRQNPLGWSVNFRHQGKGTSISLMPDRMFGLHFTEEPEGKNKTYFFLEADRATMPVMRRSLKQTSFYRKLLGYFESWNQGLHTQTYGFKNFRVLTVTTSQARVKNLIEAGKQLAGGQGSRLFLFTDKDSISRENILTLGWQSGRDKELVRLID